MAASSRNLIAFTILAMLLAACGGGGGGDSPDAEPVRFRIVEQRPIDGERYVSQDVVVTVRFSKDLDPATLGGTVTLLDGPDPVPGTLYLSDGDRTLLLVPEERLELATEYTLVLADTIASTDGEGLGREWRVSFETVLLPTPQPPKAEDFVPTFGPLNVGRSQHTATLLEDGTVLIAGGFSNSSTTTGTAEIYDPEQFLFELLGTGLSNARARHTATRLSDGRVLFVGGLGSGGDAALSTCEIYDPDQQSFATTGALMHARAYHTADLLEDGRVLVCGGAYYDTDSNFVQLAVAEVFDPTTSRWTEVPELMVRDRAFHTASRLDDGRILLAGGASDLAAEIFDPATSTFTRTAGDTLQYRGGHVAAKLVNGLILLSGGGAGRGELYIPSEDRFEPTGNSLSIDRTYATVTRTRDGGFLILGGIYFGENTLLLATMDLYSQIQGPYGSYYQVSTWLTEYRAGHTATVLDDESTLICGGINIDWTQPELRTAVLFRQD